jgi:hypothetical protein
MTGLFRIACLVILIIGNLGDSTSTYLCTKRLGIQGETNPTMIIKFVALTILAVLIYPTPYWWVNFVIGVPYNAAAINNFRKYKEKI